jgi:hypothetical protein
MAKAASIGLVMAGALLLGACGGGEGGGGLTRVRAVAPAVTYSYQGDQLDQATDRATAYCRRFAQEAKLNDLRTQDGTHFATYDCR